MGAEGAMALINNGAVEWAREANLNAEARKKGKEALAIFQDLGDLAGQAKCLNVLAMAFLGFGNLNEGKAKAKAAVQLCQEIGDKIGEGINLLLVAQLASTTTRTRQCGSPDWQKSFSKRQVRSSTRRVPRMSWNSSVSLTGQARRNQKPRPSC